MLYQSIRDSSNSVTLRYGVAGSRSPTSWLVFANGRTEWIEKYTDLFDDLKLGEGVGFLAFDHRGQGCSEGQRAWIDSYDTYAQDMAIIIKQVVGGAPYNVICHSMGGLIALVAVMRDLIHPQSLVLSSPLLGLPHRPFPAKVSGYLSGFLTSWGLGKVNTGSGNHYRPAFANNALTHSYSKYQLVQNCPYPVPSPTFAWVRATWLATQDVFDKENLGKVKCPTLVIAGTKEEVVDPECFRKWVMAASKYVQAPVEFSWVAGGKHELLFEAPEFYEKAIELVRGWILKYGRLNSV